MGYNYIGHFFSIRLKIKNCKKYYLKSILFILPVDFIIFFEEYLKLTIMKKTIFILLFFFLNKNSFADDKLALGLEVYNNKAMCGSCHVLQRADSKGNIGPNLDKLKPSQDQIIYVVKNGIGVMQAWEGILTKEEIEAVAYFVFNSINE